MDKSKAKITESEVMGFIENVSQIFAHIIDKDYFLEIYQTNVFSKCIKRLSLRNDFCIIQILMKILKNP